MRRIRQPCGERITFVARGGLAALACAWVLWAQTRTSAPGDPIRDAWDVVATFESQAECEQARVAVDPRGDAPPAHLKRTRYACFPDTLDPRATP